jgi:peptidoglycan/xylan/chitin deacetylase (PgdA/CDA1 family)
LYRRLLEEGHRTGNHTYNHLRGLLTPASRYIANVEKARARIDSDLFRPPHGYLRPSQLLGLRTRYRIVMWDVVTRDYSWRMTPEDVFEVVRRCARNGSLIVFHDSLKASRNLRGALPRSIEWLREEGYSFGLL